MYQGQEARTTRDTDQQQVCPRWACADELFRSAQSKHAGLACPPPIHPIHTTSHHTPHLPLLSLSLLSLSFRSLSRRLRSGDLDRDLDLDLERLRVRVVCGGEGCIGAER